MKNVLGTDGIKYSTIAECMAAASGGVQGYKLLGDVVEETLVNIDPVPIETLEWPDGSK